ncbi:MAG: NUDIX domain-containing protein [Bacilli bacterium]|jgi:8-oxo-dGTP pyrophosphatase MutT (NUDIX family)|nr:NUDIX domain-containing protein [Bacilli bacterium]
MKTKLTLLDDQYRFGGTPHVREISRGIVSDGKGRYAIHYLERNDIFGSYQYYETPGGGIDAGETPEAAVVRECREEIGYRVRVIASLGEVDDAYNLIGRTNHNHFYLCERFGENMGPHFVSLGDRVIKKTLWLSIPAILGLYRRMPEEGVPLLVKRREMPVWEQALVATKGK